MTIACGDSHTSTHGAFGSVAFGIGTSQVRDVLASQCLALEPLKVRRIRVTGTLPHGRLRQGRHPRRSSSGSACSGGTGYAYEYAGDAVDRMSMDERMTICNMSIEGGARVGYVNPDETTFEYLRGRPFAPPADAFDAHGGVVAVDGVGCRRGLRRRRRDAGRGADAGRDLGRQSRPVDRRRRPRAVGSRGGRRRRRPSTDALDVHGPDARASRSPA